MRSRHLPALSCALLSLASTGCATLGEDLKSSFGLVSPEYRKAKQVARDALGSCLAVLELDEAELRQRPYHSIQGYVSTYKRNRDLALEWDPSIRSATLQVGEQTAQVGPTFERCDAKLPLLQAIVQEGSDANWDSFHAAEDRRNQRLNAMLTAGKAKARGDRQSLLLQRGLPSDYPGAEEYQRTPEDVERHSTAMVGAPFWLYAWTTEGVHCQVYFHFEGDRISRTEAQPSYCLSSSR